MMFWSKHEALLRDEAGRAAAARQTVTRARTRNHGLAVVSGSAAALLLERALVVYEAALAWCLDTGECPFCGDFDGGAGHPHADDCPLAPLNCPEAL